jgi:DNA invertase Pin-like site-specific DNA recombinase
MHLRTALARFYLTSRGCSSASARFVKAQAKGRYKARPKSAALLASEARQMVADGKTGTEAAKALGIARASVYGALEASEA